MQGSRVQLPNGERQAKDFLISFLDGCVLPFRIPHFFLLFVVRRILFCFCFSSILTERPTQCCEGRIALSLTPKQYLGALWLELMGRKWTLKWEGGVARLLFRSCILHLCCCLYLQWVHYVFIRSPIVLLFYSLKVTSCEFIACWQILYILRCSNRLKTEISLWPVQQEWAYLYKQPKQQLQAWPTTLSQTDEKVLVCGKFLGFVQTASWIALKPDFLHPLAACTWSFHDCPNADWIFVKCDPGHFRMWS